MFNLTKQILRDMWARKLRSILALFGVMWGTLTVILLLAVGTGFQKASQKNVMQLTDGAFFIIPQKTTKSFHGLPEGRSIKIKAKVIADLSQHMSVIQAATPILQTAANIRYQSNQIEKMVVGVSSQLLKLRRFNLISKSRFFNPLDVQNTARVVVLGNKVKKLLFKNQPAIGKKVFINQAPFLVIGVIEPAQKGTRAWYDNNLIIPYTTYKMLWGDQNVTFFSVLPDRALTADQAELALRTYFGHRYHFDKTDKTALKIFNTTKIFNFFKWFFIGIQLFLGACGALTLAVGSLGVANIMFLIVTERKKEIGLRMAVGAKQWQIFLQILLEAFLINFLGALMGFLIAYFIVQIFYYRPLPDWLGQPEISPLVVMITIFILTVLGTFSGFFPAKRAAKMDPVDALSG